MKIVQINTVCGQGSTGKICVAVGELLSEKAVANDILYAYGNGSEGVGIRYMSYAEVKCQALCSRVFGNYGFNSRAATRRLLRELDRIHPDIVHLHNLHGHNCHLGMLFTYLRERRIKVFYTFHDCWAFTGYCPHYDMIGCDHWQTECQSCPQRREYSWFFDRSRTLFRRKRALLSDWDLTVVTPSVWLAEQVRKSFLRDCEIKVIHNGIDLSVFRPMPSDFREKYGLTEKKIVLGVAFGWGARKGLDVFIELAKRLDERYQIVLVGTDEKVDRVLPENILSIHRTQDQNELAAIYTAADVFANPTREENYPTVNMEAIACGTPVVTFATGGSAEVLDADCGVAVAKNDIDAMEREIRRVCEERPFTFEGCQKRAESFDKNKCFQAYLQLYAETEDV